MVRGEEGGEKEECCVAQSEAGCSLVSRLHMSTGDGAMRKGAKSRNFSFGASLIRPDAPTASAATAS